MEKTADPQAHATLPKSTANTFPRTRRSDAGAKLCSEQFEAHFGRKPEVIAFSPGRVNLIGEHTDYNDGFVMPFALEQGIWVAAAQHPGAAGRAEICSSAAGMENTAFLLENPISRGEAGWGRYLRGVAQGVQDAGISLTGFQAFIHGNLPSGGGLSSSAALEVSFGLALLQLAGARLSSETLAKLCQQAEHRYAGTPCGIMDQFAVLFSQKDHVLQLDCRTLATKAIPVAQGAPMILVFNTMVKHALNDGGYEARRKTCEAAAASLNVPALRDATLDDLEKLTDPLELRRARHVITENARCLAAADALTAGDWPTLGKLLLASHASLRDDFQVSCAELDLVVELAQSRGPTQGIFGSRMTGGGFGGCCIALVDENHAEETAKWLAETYLSRTGIAPVVFFAQPSESAGVVGEG